MKLQKSEDNSNVLIENNNGCRLYIGKNDSMKYFSMEIAPCDGNISFRIKDVGENEVESFVYKAFRELLDDILDNYFEVGFIRMEVDLKEKFIRTITHNPSYNVLEIRLDGASMDVVVSIIRGMQSDSLNNRVLLDNGDTLSMGYYNCFQNLLDKLVQEVNRGQAGETLVHK